jgi:hypothetical protein
MPLPARTIANPKPLWEFDFFGFVHVQNTI